MAFWHPAQSDMCCFQLSITALISVLLLSGELGYVERWEILFVLFLEYGVHQYMFLLIGNTPVRN